MSTRIIGLSGLARSGKDESARALTARGWERRAFADTLRSFLFALNPLVSTDVRVADLVRAYGWEKAKGNPEVRELLQRCGTEAGRQVLGTDVWVKAALSNLGPLPVVVCDVRYKNEVQAIRDLGGAVYRVERPGVEAPRTASGEVHVSERALDGVVFDGVIHNDGTLGELHEKVLALVHPLREVAAA